jgi:IclR family transcriptional regulator, acetate operon repressor
MQSAFHTVKLAGFARPLVGYPFPGSTRARDISMARTRSTFSQSRSFKPSGGKSRRIIQSVDRALAIIEALAQDQHGLALMELGARAGLNISTCHHLLMTLQRRGYVVQDKQTKEYSLGNKIFELSDARERQLDLVSVAKPYIRSLNRLTGEATHLAVVEAGQLATLVKMEATHAVRVDATRVGKSNAAHAAANGKAILAYLPRQELDDLIANVGLPRFTASTIRSREQLERELGKIRSQGYAEDYEEFQPGVLCFGAPIFNHEGQVVGALSCSVPTMRSSKQLNQRLRRLVIEGGRKISRDLGYRGPTAETREANRTDKEKEEIRLQKKS